MDANKLSLVRSLIIKIEVSKKNVFFRLVIVQLTIPWPLSYRNLWFSFKFVSDMLLIYGCEQIITDQKKCFFF